MTHSQTKVSEGVVSTTPSQPQTAVGIEAALLAQDLRRQLVVEALDGVVTQASWAARFLELGDPDMHVEGAMSRMAAFARAALATMKEVSAETRRLAGAKVTN